MDKRLAALSRIAALKYDRAVHELGHLSMARQKLDAKLQLAQRGKHELITAVVAEGCEIAVRERLAEAMEARVLQLNREIAELRAREEAHIPSVKKAFGQKNAIDALIKKSSVNKR